MTKSIFTFGYEGLSLDDFISRLKRARVKTVIDVRANPLSRKRGFSKRALAIALGDAGIAYRHAVAMGCPKPVRDRYREDGDWTKYTRAFLKYLNDQQAGLGVVAQIAEASSSCLICFEADFNRCHRTYVARAVARIAGMRVQHITQQTEIPDSQAEQAAA